MNLNLSFNQFYQENGYAIIPDVIGSDETAYAQNRRGVTLVTN